MCVADATSLEMVAGMTNRHEKRARASVQRKSNVSVALVQKQLQAQSEELQQLRNVLFALVKEQGRIRIKKSTVATLGAEDGLEAVEETLGGEPCYVVTYKKHQQESAS